MENFSHRIVLSTPDRLITRVLAVLCMVVVVLLPIFFVAEDTLGVTSYFKQAVMSGLILQFAYTYTDNNRQKLSKF